MYHIANDAVVFVTISKTCQMHDNRSQNQFIPLFYIFFIQKHDFFTLSMDYRVDIKIFGYLKHQIEKLQ